MKRLLFLYVGPYYDPQAIPAQGKFTLLSRRYCGDIVAVISEKRHRTAQIGNFTLRGVYLPALIRMSTLWRDIAYGAIALVRVIYAHYFRNRYDAIIAPEPLVAGVLALLMGRLTGARVVVEVNGQFESAFKYEVVKPSLKDRLKEKYARTMAPAVLSRADAVKLLYPGQVVDLVGDRPLPHSHCFANFVSTSQFREGRGASKYILFLGYPWYLKGVDVLIQAFQRVSPDFPEYSLKVVGWCTDKTLFETLAAGNPRIDLCDPVAYPEVIKLMAECSMFVLPSRTEGIARVLSEAMASRKPIIASNIGGIPAIIHHGMNGLLFASEDVEDLAAKLRMLLANPQYAQELADNGQRYVREELSEAKYLERFSSVIEHATTTTRNGAVASARRSVA